MQSLTLRSILIFYFLLHDYKSELLARIKLLLGEAEHLRGFY